MSDDMVRVFGGTDTSKLTNWAKEPTLKELKLNLDVARNSHDKNVNKIIHWRELLRIDGKEKVKKNPNNPNRSTIVPKVVRRQAEWRYSALTEPFLGSDRIFQVNPRTFEDVNAARQCELLLNWQFDTKLNKVKLIDNIVRACVNEGTAIIRVGWDRQTKPTIEMVPKYAFMPSQQPALAQQIQQAQQLKEANPRQYEDLPDPIKAVVTFLEENPDKQGQIIQAVPIGEEPVQSEEIIENKPIIELMRPENVYVDPSCDGDIDKAMFIICSMEVNKAELLQAGIYKNLDKVNWDENIIQAGNNVSHTSNISYDESAQMKDKLLRRVVAYEFWGYKDIEGNGSLTPIVATWIGDTLIRMEVNPYPDKKLPFVFIPYSPVEFSLYGEPDAEILEENQHISGAILRSIIDLMGRSANSQQAFAKGMLDAVNKRRFEQGLDYEYNPGGLTPANGGYLMHSFPEIPQSAFNLLQQQNLDAEALTGIKAFTEGITSTSYGDVATGIRGALSASGKREMAILRRIAKGVCDIGSKIIAMNTEFLSDEEVIRVTNSKFEKIKREDIKGNFDLKVDINTAELDQAKSQDLAFVLQTVGPNIGDPTFMSLILAKIADLKKLPDLAEMLRNWQPQPDPVMEENKQLQNELLKAQIAQYNATAQQRNIDAEITANGIKHERALELQQAQGQANMDLEVEKAIGRSLKEGETAPNVEGMIGWNLQRNAMKARANLQNPVQDITLRGFKRN